MTHGSGTAASEISRSPSPSAIRALPPLLINQIAAGEVIERPASVLKELVENAIDAEASRIRVELERGGIELIRVTDDGCGIPEDQLILAIAPHATSKIAIAEDLDRIATMGFRGEAMASIASISRMSVRSRPPSATAAAIIEIEGGDASPIRPASGPLGTTVEVRNLFFNTPARRKFLRTPTTEQTRCKDWLTDLALARPGIAFQLVCDGKTALDLASADGPRRRILDILGSELESELIEARLDQFDDARGVTIWGLVGLPSIARATAKAQHVFINGRAVRDRTIQHALREAYRGLIEPGRHPTAVIMLEISPQSVDVNVHPAKLEVRFRDQSSVHQSVLRAVRDALRSADLTPALPTKRSASDTQILPPPSSSSGSRAFVDYFRRDISASADRLDFDAVREAVARADRAHTPVAPSPIPPDERGSASSADQQSTSSVSDRLLEPRPHSRALQVHNQYLVTQDATGLLLIDQHALHERVMFEKLLARVTNAPLERQRLLTPAVVQASPSTIDRLDDLRPLFDRVGVACEALSPTSIAIHEFPTLLFERRVDPVEFLEELLAALDADRLSPNDEQALHEVLDMMACKAAIKAGDRLSEEEIAELLALRDHVERSSNCPHGRPTTIRVTIDQLDRMFGRT